MKKYWAIFKLQLANGLAYPGEFIGRSLLILPFMWIFFQLWRVTFDASGGAEINGLTLRSTLWYLVIAEVIELSRPRVANTISEAVKDGSIAYILSKPYNFLWYHYSSSLADTIFRALLNLVLGGGVAWLLVGPPPSLWGLLAVLPLLMGAWALNYCIAALIGLLAFWVEDTSAFQWIYQKLAFILGGLLIPLDFYPAWLRTIADALPFSAVTYAPARLFVEPSLNGFLAALGQQALWLLVFAGGLGLLYRRSVTVLTVNGG
ncbi:MAG TPA: ABC-2 family transporter protein [Anaerolineaceae bacterium]|jgi:ABC-2 type transport system permease protein|nr:ABC-2 family transporter protein [Anaerolineaceae bacterium]